MIQTISHQFKLNYFNHEKRRPIQHLLHLVSHLWLDAGEHFKPFPVRSIGGIVHYRDGLCI